MHHLNISLENIVQEIDGVVYVEEWRPIKDHETIYQISSFGRIKRLSRILKISGKVVPDKIMKPSSGKNKKTKRYLKFSLRRNGKSKSISIHRLVGLHFIPLIEGKPHINHKTGIKTDNHFSQLEWCTPQENNEHGVAMGLLKRGINKKPYIRKGRAHVPRRYKKIVDLTTNEIYSSPKELSEKTGIPIKTIRRCLSGERINKTNYRYVGQEGVLKMPAVKEKEKLPIALFDMDWNFKSNFVYKDQAAKHVNASASDINEFLNGKRSHVKGYKFKKIAEDGSYIEPTPFVSKKPPLKPKKIPQPTTPSKSVVKYDLDGSEMQRFNSFSEAARHCGADKGNLRKIMNGKTKGRPGYYKGFFYRYA